MYRDYVDRDAVRTGTHSLSYSCRGPWTSHWQAAGAWVGI